MENLNPRNVQAKFYLSPDAVALLHEHSTLTGTHMSAVVDRLVRAELPREIELYKRPIPAPRPNLRRARKRALPDLDI